VERDNLFFRMERGQVGATYGYTTAPLQHGQLQPSPPNSEIDDENIEAVEIIGQQKTGDDEADNPPPYTQAAAARSTTQTHQRGLQAFKHRQQMMGIHRNTHLNPDGGTGEQPMSFFKESSESGDDLDELDHLGQDEGVVRVPLQNVDVEEGEVQDIDIGDVLSSSSAEGMAGVPHGYIARDHNPNYAPSKTTTTPPGQTGSSTVKSGNSTVKGSPVTSMSGVKRSLEEE
jgi:hypothetical protein